MWRWLERASLNNFSAPWGSLSVLLIIFIHASSILTNSRAAGELYTAILTRCEADGNGKSAALCGRKCQGQQGCKLSPTL